MNNNNNNKYKNSNGDSANGDIRHQQQQQQHSSSTSSGIIGALNWRHFANRINRPSRENNNNSRINNKCDGDTSMPTLKLMNSNNIGNAKKSASKGTLTNGDDTAIFHHQHVNGSSRQSMAMPYCNMKVALDSNQNYKNSAISPFDWINGYNGNSRAGVTISNAFAGDGLKQRLGDRHSRQDFVNNNFVSPPGPKAKTPLSPIHQANPNPDRSRRPESLRMIANDNGSATGDGDGTTRTYLDCRLVSAKQAALAESQCAHDNANRGGGGGRKTVIQASTSELLRCLGEFLRRTCRPFLKSV